MKFLLVTGVIMFIVSISLFITNYYKLDIERNGEIVKMKIEKLPKSCVGSKVRYFVTFSYQGKLFYKLTRGNFCKKHHVGELVNIKYLNGYDTIFYPDESVLMNEIATLILALTGIGISIFQWFKIKR